MSYGLKNMYKRFDDTVVFENFSIEFEENAVNCLFGPSGCGKTTILDLLSGLEKIDKGEIYGCEDKTFSYIFQEYRLFEWMTVKENVKFVLKDKVNPREEERKAQRYLKLVKLGKCMDKYPHELSGGMKQRVSIARALAISPDFMLIDEPFVGLDITLKKSLIDIYNKIWSQINLNVIMITHDLEDALLTADYIYVLSQKPTKVLNKFQLIQPRMHRHLSSPELLRIKKQIIDLLKENIT